MLSLMFLRWSTLAVAVMAAVLLLETGAQAQSLRQGVSAFNRQDYMQASRVFIPLAERGNPSAQAYLGFMFETGRGVPRNYTEAAMWYRRAAEQGDSLAQYSLGLLYDRGSACRAISLKPTNGSISRLPARPARHGKRGRVFAMP